MRSQSSPGKTAIVGRAALGARASAVAGPGCAGGRAGPHAAPNNSADSSAAVHRLITARNETRSSTKAVPPDDSSSLERSDSPRNQRGRSESPVAGEAVLQQPRCTSRHPRGRPACRSQTAPRKHSALCYARPLAPQQIHGSPGRAHPARGHHSQSGDATRGQAADTGVLAHRAATELAGRPHAPRASPRKMDLAQRRAAEQGLL